MREKISTKGGSGTEVATSMLGVESRALYTLTFYLLWIVRFVQQLTSGGVRRCDWKDGERCKVGYW